ncbi:MAG: hypothetical protein ACKVS8_11485 [Phycisphaerales bacterium]
MLAGTTMCVAATGTAAAPVMVALGGDCKRITLDKDALDFHLTVKNTKGDKFVLKPTTFKETDVAGYTKANNGTESENTAIWLGNFKAKTGTGAAIPYSYCTLAANDKLAASFTFTPFFTFDGAAPPVPALADPPQPVASLGWRVDDNGDIYALNELEGTAVEFADLRLTIGATTDLASHLAGLVDVPSGTPATVSMGSVPGAAGGIPGELLVGNFALADFTVFSAVMSVRFADAGVSPLEHTQSLGIFTVPGPGAALLFSLGGAIKARRRRSGLSA